MNKVKWGGDARGQKAENLEMKRSSASLIADTPPMMKKMALLTLGHLLFRILFNKLTNKLKNKRPRKDNKGFVFHRDNSSV